MRPYTVNVSGSERHDGEKPHTMVVEADTMAQAKCTAWLWFIWNIASERGKVAADGTIPDRPDLDLLASRSDDVVIVDCPEFPCHAGEPFTCGGPCHYEPDIDDRDPDCTCAFYWYWAHDEEQMDLNRLKELGYQISDIASEENHW